MFGHEQLSASPGEGIHHPLVRHLVGAELALDPELGQLIREPLKDKLYRVGKIFRCKFMTAPGCQFEIRSAAFKRIEAALAESGLSFAGGAPQTILVRRAEPA